MQFRQKKKNQVSGAFIRYVLYVAFYEVVVLDAALYRSVSDDYCSQYPKVFPPNFGAGYKLHDVLKTKRQNLLIRRIKLRNRSVYEVVPSDYMPYLIGKTDDVGKGLYLRK